MKSIKIKCPAKINLTLEIVNRREDGFHNIKSIMQMINLFDFLDISTEKSEINSVILSGNSDEIPYDNRNLVYKAADLFLKESGITGYSIKINIEKNIPVAAGLAGGSSDAAGTLLGLNKLFDNIFTKNKLHELASRLGSDLNVCLEGGCILATSRGEQTEKLPETNYPVTLIKPKNLGISAKEAYTKYAEKEFKPKYNMTEKMTEAINTGKSVKPYLYNDLEYAVFDDYEELQYIKQNLPNAVMSGSGSTYFILEKSVDTDLLKEYTVIDNLHFIESGTEEFI